MARVWLVLLVLVSQAMAVQVPPAEQKVPVERKLYVGKDSTEATLRFDFHVLIDAERTPTEEEATEKIESQVLHLFGPMGEAKYKAVPRGNHRISDVSVDTLGRGRYRASYRYEGTIVVKNGPESELPVILPFNPDTIYEAGVVKRLGRKRYPCTDEHYNGEGDFWYFWNPAKRGCPLKKDRDYAVVKGRIKRLKNTTSTYPEYARLVDRQGVIRVDVLLGMDKEKHNINPFKSKDINAPNFVAIHESLVAMGYSSRVLSAQEIRAVAGPLTGATVPFVEELEMKERNATLKVRLFFGPSGIDESSQAFHYFFKDALENAAVMIYDGHSGLGGHLDLAAIEEARKFRFGISPEQYQIYFFNSCSSYPYYNTMFFNRKKSPSDPNGTKQLDILTNGLATYFSVMHDTNLALIKALHAWAAGKGSVSYQALARQIDSDNLFGVNGDEDNPTTPNGVH